MAPSGAVLPTARWPLRRQATEFGHAGASVLFGLGADRPNRDQHDFRLCDPVVLLRLAGPRELAQWYAFDLIVTVAPGSTFVNNVLSSDATVAQAGVGFVMLIGLQFIVSWVVLHWSPARVAVNSPPTMIFHQGKFLQGPMRMEKGRRSGHSRSRAAAWPILS